VVKRSALLLVKTVNKTSSGCAASLLPLNLRSSTHAVLKTLMPTKSMQALLGHSFEK